MNEKDIKWIANYFKIDKSKIDSYTIKIVKKTLAFQLYKFNEAWDNLISEVKKSIKKIWKQYI